MLRAVIHPATLVRVSLVILAITLVPGSNPALAETVLADQGAARMPLVLHREATEKQREIAQSFSEYLQRISGAEFEVITANGSQGIVLGTIQQFPQEDWGQALRVQGRDGIEAFRIQTTPNRVLVLGATDLGLDRAVTRMLEELGCRWFFPNEAWHVVPQRDRLGLDLNVTERPALLSRVIWWNWGYWDNQARQDWKQWMRRNYLGESLNVRCGHAWQRIIRQYQDRFDEHPEYLALRITEDAETGEIASKERSENKFCVSNPAVVDLCQQYALDYFAKNPNADMVSMEPSDGGGHCECEECRAMGSVSQRVHYLTNEVAKVVGDRYPNKFVGTYAYNVHSEPPDFVMEPNVYVQITAGFTRGRYTFKELIEEWHEHVKQLGVYEYLNVWAWSRDMPGASRGANTEYLATHIPYYAARGCTTISCEAGGNYGPNGLGYLVASRLMWDPEADVEAIRSDFHQQAFGPAAEPMRRYYERFEGGNAPLVSDHLLALAYRDLAEASKLAAGRPAIGRRIDDLKLYLYYVEIMRELAVPQEKQERLRAVERLLRFAYRTRHRYIVHNTGIRGRYATYYLRGIEQPDEWKWRQHGEETAWYTGDPYTHQEVQQLFQTGLSQHQVLDFEERRFSSDLVPAKASPVEGAPRCRQIFQGSRTFVFHAAGKRLPLRLLTGFIAHYRDREPAEWKLIQGEDDDRVISRGELPLDGEWHDLSIKVPEPGCYRLNVDDSGAGWRIDYKPGTPAVWPLEKGERIYGLGGSTEAVYFHVPEGTRRLAYYVEGTAHAVVDSDGEEAVTVEAQPGNVVVVDVPGGQDGTVWCLRDLKFRRLWFYNCPNYLAALPQDMMVPREVGGESAGSEAETHRKNIRIQEK
ncbi:MAG: DUF4838 domain-containing protein [Planctomycetota bacterium]